MTTIETTHLREEALELLTVAEAASILRLSRPTIYRLVSDGTLPAHKIGGSIRIDREEMLAALTTPIRLPEDTP